MDRPRPLSSASWQQSLHQTPTSSSLIQACRSRGVAPCGGHSQSAGVATIARQDHQSGRTDKQLGPLSGEVTATVYQFCDCYHVAPWSIIVGQSWHQASGV